MTRRYLWTASLLLALPTGTSARQYRDAYPINPDLDMIGYVFSVTLSDTTDTIQGVTTATARFLASGHQELRLDLIDAAGGREGRGMIVTHVESGGQSLAFQHLNDQLVIDLGRIVPAGERVVVTTHYYGEPAGGLRIGPNKYGERTFFSDNWSSRVRNWLPVVDHPSDKATTEMVVIAPAHYQVASNGTVVEVTDLGDGTRLTHYVNPVPTAPWLYFLGVAEFAVQHVGTFEGIPIETWVYGRDRDDGFHDFVEPSKQVLAFYSDLIGPYVYDRLANVVSPATSGGMEAASTPAYSERSVSGERTRRWQDVIVHEIAHQWFGNAVTEYHWNDVWLSEGFATYYTLLFRQHRYGYDDFLEGLRASRNTVIRFYDETDYDFQIVRDYIADLNDVSGPMMYQKGAWVLHMLREQLGHEAYDLGIRSYYAEFMNRNVTTGDLRRHLEEASGRDLQEFFRQWLFQGGIPELLGTWSFQDGELGIRVRQVQRRYEFTLDVDFGVELADGSTDTITVRVDPEGGGSTTRSYDQDVVNVVIDPTTRLLAKWRLDRR